MLINRHKGAVRVDEAPRVAPHDLVPRHLHITHSPAYRCRTCLLCWRTVEQWVSHCSVPEGGRAGCASSARPRRCRHSRLTVGASCARQLGRQRQTAPLQSLQPMRMSLPEIECILADSECGLTGSEHGAVRREWSAPSRMDEEPLWRRASRESVLGLCAPAVPTRDAPTLI